MISTIITFFLLPSLGSCAVSTIKQTSCSVLGAGMLPTIDKCAELVKTGARIVPGSIKVLHHTSCGVLLDSVLLWKQALPLRNYYCCSTSHLNTVNMLLLTP